jgi:hypothetical protein
MLNCNLINKDLYKIISKLKNNYNLAELLECADGVEVKSTPFYFDENKSDDTLADSIKAELRIFFNKYNTIENDKKEVEYKFQIIINNDNWTMDDGTSRALYILDLIFKELGQYKEIGLGGLKFEMDEIKTWGSKLSGYELIAKTIKK